MINRRLLCCLSVVLAVIFASCTNGSFDTADDSGGSSGTKVIEEHSHHPYLWDLQEDGSWKCSHCHEYIEGTTGAYWAELDDNGQPKLIYTIKSPYTYTGGADNKTVIIRTVGGTLNIDAPNDTILHYGFVDTVNFSGEVYKGRAGITTELIATSGNVWIHEARGEDVPIVMIPSGATGPVHLAIDSNVYVHHIEMDSSQAAEIFVEGYVELIDVIGTGTTNIEVEGMIDTLDDESGTAIVSGTGFINDNNGGGAYNLPIFVEVAGVYPINNQMDLRALRYYVRQGNDFATKTIQLQDNINMTGLWEPIAAWTDGTGNSTPSFNGVFRGIFDGNNKSINNLRIASSTHSYQALFGKTEGATFLNLTVNGAVSCVEEAAGVVAYMKGGTMTNVTSNVAVSANRMAGGLVARVHVTDSAATTFTDCINDGVITGRSTGGNSGIGGIAGEVQSNGTVDFDSCINRGMSDDTNGTHVGGILGNLKGDSSAAVTFTDCKNVATVYGGRTGVTAKIGGILGAINSNSSSNTITFDGCANTGSISSNAMAGGILGYQSSSIANFVNCQNSGIIISTDSGYYAGGIAGTIRRGSIDNNCKGGKASITATYPGRLVGRVMNTSAGNVEIDLADEQVGSVNMNTIGMTAIQTTSKTVILGGTLYGKPYAKDLGRIEFKNGSNWKQDSSTTINFTSDYVSTGTAGTTNWTTP